MNPRHPLLAVPESAPDPQFEGDQHRLQSAAIPPEHRGYPEEDNTQSKFAGPDCLSLPVFTDIRKKALSRCTLLRQDLVAAVAVETYGRGGYKHRWLVSQLADSGNELAGSINPAF